MSRKIFDSVFLTFPFSHHFAANRAGLCIEVGIPDAG